MTVLLFILLLIAGLSPLLTFARLWQIKEWRFDRLREHLRHEGYVLQLFGWVRPLVVCLGLCALIAMKFWGVQLHAQWATLGALAWFTLFRIVIGKQARPVWTKKSVVVMTLSLVLFAVAGGWLILLGGKWAVPIALMLAPLFAFVCVVAAHIALFPLDRALKNRILSRARKLRAQHTNLTVVGITGSVGKTTTKELLAHILSDRSILATPAYVNTELGVADLIIRQLKQEHQIMIVEMGAYKRGEIRVLCSLTTPQIGIITYIGRQHLGLFGSQVELCRAKGELFEALPPSGHAFLNADTMECEELMKRASCPVHTVGTGGHASFEAFDIQESSDGVAFTLRDVAFTVPIPGTHQVTNILLAVAAAEALGMPIAESAKRLKSFRGPAQTFERKEGVQGQIVLDDTHNASPASFRAAIEWAKASRVGTKVLVTSGLLELGKEECAIHRELGALAREVFDTAIFLSKKCVRSFEQGYGKNVQVASRGKIKLALHKDLLVVCEGRMKEALVQSLLS